MPTADVRGNITSHRARSTIASQLYNAKEPMTLFELQAWLGHQNPATTQHYAKITPNTLSKAYTQAGYFARNVRTIEILLDREAVTSGAAAGGEPWQYYNLGHGLCSYTFFEQCPHRMACAKCDFYTPKNSSKAQILEAKDNLQRMLATIPLTDDERAAVNDGQAALDSLLGRLADIPTPAARAPRIASANPPAHHRCPPRKTRIKADIQIPQNVRVRRRLLPGGDRAPVGLAEDTVRLAAALRPALASRGVPERIYVDNGSAFVDAWLLRACAKLGICLTHSAPGRPPLTGQSLDHLPVTLPHPNRPA